MDRDLGPRKSKVLQHKTPTARRRALRENVQQTRLKGLSLRAMARELGVHRNTIRKYALAESPSLRKKKSEASTPQPETGAPPNRTLYLWGCGDIEQTDRPLVRQTDRTLVLRDRRKARVAALFPIEPGQGLGDQARICKAGPTPRGGDHGTGIHLHWH